MEFPATTPPRDDGDEECHQCPCRPTNEDCKDFLAVAKRTLPTDEYNEFLRALKNLSQGDMWEKIGKVGYLLKDHEDLLFALAALLPESLKQQFFQGIPKYTRASAFIRKVKNYFMDEDDRFHLFIATLHNFGEINKEEFDEKVAAILENNKLIEEFQYFAPLCVSNGDDLHHTPSCGSHHDESETGIGFAHGKKFNTEREWKRKHLEEGHGENEERDELQKYIQGQNLLKVVDYPTTEEFDGEEEDYQTSLAMDEDSIMDFDLKIHDTGHGSFSDSDCKRARETLGEVCSASSTEADSYRNCMPNSKEALSLRNAKICTPSYQFLPKNYPILPASKRTSLGTSVLNNVVVSVTSGSEGSFKLRRKNQYEEILFRCEDDRYELDMLLETSCATIKKVEKLLEILQDGENQNEHGIKVQKYLTSQNMRCIECIYGIYGVDIVDSLCKDPSGVLHVVLTRLKQRQEIWSRCRIEFQKRWDDVYSKNHRKSLDHRGFYFKKQDANNWSAKALLAEVKKLKEKSQEENDALVASILGDISYGVPDMEFEYTDKEIHEDMYNIIKFACNEFCSSKEQFKKITTIWTTFLESMLGLSPRFQAIEPFYVDLKDERQDGSYNKNDLGIEASTSSSTIGEIQEINRIADKDDRRYIGSETDTEYGPNNLGSEFDDSNERLHKVSDGEEKVAEKDIKIDIEDKETIDADDLMGLETPLSFSGPHLDTLKPLNTYSDEVSHVQEYNSRVFYGNSSFYTLFRLHQILYERIHSAKTTSFKSQKELTGPSNSSTVDHYARFLNALFSLLGRNINNSTFEDECRDNIGSQSYMLFTLDKLIQQIIKQVQAIASNKEDNKFLQLYEYETSRKRGSSYDLRYSKDAHVVSERDLFRFTYSTETAMLSIKSVEFGNKEDQVTIASLDPGIRAYLFTDLLKNAPPNETTAGIILRRNFRKPLNDDEAMEGVQIFNGLQCKLQTSIKSSYVLGTEDILFRARKKRGLSVDPIDEGSVEVASGGSTRRRRRIHDIL